ncbi:MAG: hypothetical protein QOD77_310 [Thermoplasmata archaeon]|jgi:predicted transcriptional regulator|nr:hypothetical protein [Thermoplasmata archaeon]
MRVAAALLILLLLAATASGGVVLQSDVAFQVPAQLDGATVVQGGWVLAYVGAGALELQGSTPLLLTNRTTSYVAGWRLGSLQESHGLPDESETTQQVPGVATRLQAQPVAGAFWLKAKQLTVAFRGPSVLGAADGAASAYGLAGMNAEAQASARNRDLGAATAYLAAADAEVVLQAAGVEEVEWFGFEAACGCLPSGGRHGVGVDAPPARAGNTAYSYIGLEGTMERGAFTGAVQALFVGGSWLDLEVNGTARLPLAAPPADCPRCIQTENRTLWAQGRLALSDLVFRDRRTLGASLGGELVAARLDERPVDPWALAGLPMPTTFALGVVGGVAGSVMLALGLFTRFSKEKALENENRRGLYEAILQNPGIPFRELVRRSQVAAGTARYHLTVLVRAGLVVEKSHHNLLRFFENHGKYEATWAQVGLLRDASLRQLHEWMQASGPRPQKDILAAWEAQGWSRSTTQHRLRRLVQDGLLQVVEHGRYKVYQVAAPPRSFHSPPRIPSRVSPFAPEPPQTSL